MNGGWVLKEAISSAFSEHLLDVHVLVEGAYGEVPLDTIRLINPTTGVQRQPVLEWCFTQGKVLYRLRFEISALDE